MSFSPLRFWDLMSRRLRAVRGEESGERGAALAITVLFMVLIGGISIVMLSVLVNQFAPSLAAQQSTRAGYSAQAGLQAGLGAIRSAVQAPDPAGVVYGNRSALPCTVTGSADGTVGGLPFEAEIRYFTLDPSNRDDAWLDANDLTCVPGSGVSTQPRYALVISNATSLNEANTDFERERSISALYEFNLTNVNIPGGRIFNGPITHCLRAEGTNPNARLRFYPVDQCTNDELELWVYDTDWKIKLASTLAVGETPMCITGPTDRSRNDQTSPARLLRCEGPSSPDRWNQLWSWEGSQNWIGQQRDINRGVSNYCLNPPTGANITGQELVARHNGCTSTMSPSPEVGAGAAGFPTLQIVNFLQFGRCADVTSERIAHPYMIVFPCKQDPTGTGNGILWNHKWRYQEPIDLVGSLGDQEISVLNLNRATERRCLTTQPDTSTNRYVVFQICTGDPRQKWTRVAQSSSYENSWLFVDTYGRCLTADTNDLHAGQYAKMTTVACDGTTAQKWNAPPNATSASFGGYREVAD